MRYTLGIDIGTFESKAALVDQNGHIIATASHPHKMHVPQMGWAEHDPEQDWWGSFMHLSNQVITESRINPKHINAVGASAIGPCMLPVDEAGNPLMNGVLYGVDTRAHEEIRQLTDEIGEDAILRLSGNTLTSQAVGPKIKWFAKNHPQLFQKTHKIIGATSFIVHRLTGNYVVDHYSAAGNAPLYDPSTTSWTDRYSKNIAPLDLLPDIAWTTDIAGTVTMRAAEQTGLAHGTPVITGTIDAAAEAISVGVTSPGQMMLMYGSTVFIILVTNKRVDDTRLWYAPWLFPGQHATMSGLATSGTLTHWFRENLATEFTDPRQAAIALAEEAATSPPGARGLVMLPYFSGERTPIHDPNAKGMIFGLTLMHTRADIYRALLEGIAHATRHVTDTYAEVGIPPLHIEAVGGGTNNSVWSQATSDITGHTQNLRIKTMGAAYGNAFLAAIGAGEAKLGDINSWNPSSREITPNPTTATVYKNAHHTFLELYRRNRDLM